MKFTWEDLTIRFDHIPTDELLADWNWKLEGNGTPLLISRFGDLFLKMNDGKITWLSVISGELKVVSADAGDFAQKLQDPNIINEWFMVPVFGVLQQNGLKPKKEQIYAMKKLPVFQGKYEAQNFTLGKLQDFLKFTGKVHHTAYEVEQSFDANNWES